MIHHGDCLDVMRTLDAASVDAVVTDPPYDLTSTGARKGSPRVPGTGPYSRGFMGKEWDGTGIAFRPETWEAALRLAKPSAYLLAFGGTRTVHRMACAIEDAGWVIRDMLVWGYASGFPKSHASLKPAWEPIVMARKPGPLRMLNIDGCRIGTDGGGGNGLGTPFGVTTIPGVVHAADQTGTLGRWPANVVLTDPIFDAGFHANGETGLTPFDTSGTYSRFFLVPKAARSDREPVLGGGPERVVSVWGGDEDDLTPGKKSTVARRNVHPTVKPTELMRHLVRLVTPAGGTVLDPFLGSGTTALAAEMEGFEWVGIEREAEYVEIAEARLNGTQRGLGLGA